MTGDDSGGDGGGGERGRPLKSPRIGRSLPAHHHSPQPTDRERKRGREKDNK